ncbi:Glucose-1-phosphate adenylyltransferase [Zostera marina]|uniref:glucose-1-phosphate adenylyltransferase n=1 Tax=Zostera marina TaxID=29655 RepID=A0A0K9NR09_ZOSMR|nr:Glucose-1-phosphate adenylyltransferase [Zostera marina]
MAAMAGSYSGAAALTTPQRPTSSSPSSSNTCRFYGERVFVSKYLQWSRRRKGGRDSSHKTPIIVCPKAISDSKTSQTCLDPKASKSVLGIILGGGAGTELYPLTKKRAKPAVPLGANYRLIDIPVSNCLNSDIAKIYVLTQFNSASLNRHLSIAYATTMGGYRNEGFVEVLAAQQSPENPNWFQGTADAIRQYLWLFEEQNVKEFLILSGDNLYRMDYELLIEAHRESNADITIGAIPIDDRQANHSSSGDLLKIDGEGRVVGFCEKHDLNKGGYNYIQRSMGIYVVNKDIMLNLLRRLLPLSNDLRTEVIPGAISSGMNVQTYLFHGYWEDIGTIESFYNANMAITKRPTPDFSFYDRSSPIYTQPRYLPPSKMLDVDTKDSVIGEGCILQKCKIYHSVVGLRSCISEGVVIEDTLLMGADYYENEVDKKIIVAKDGVSIGIGKNSRIKKAIIDKNARIGNNTKIINVDGVEEAARETDGYFIKNGIITIIKDAVIPSGSII